MRLLGVVVLAILLTGCNFFHQSEIKACHDSVQSNAKYQAKITSTETRYHKNAYGDSERVVEGQAKLQNGFGAWTNYSYYCAVSTSGRVSRFKLEEGYKSF